MRILAVIIFIICNITLLSQNFKVMSYNIRYAAPENYHSGNGWNDRKGQLIQFLDYAHLTDSYYKHYLSDHLPVVINIMLKDSK